MWKKLGIVLFGSLAALLIGSALFLPSEATVTRSLGMEAKPETVFSNIADLRGWTSWSPWYAKDKQTQMSYSADPATGVGAEAEWRSESLGSGSMTITELEPPKVVVLALDFGSQGTAKVRFELEPIGEDGTRVTWSMTSQLGNNPIRKLFGLAIDSLAGPDFEDGLKRLKDWTEFEEALKSNPEKGSDRS